MDPIPHHPDLSWPFVVAKDTLDFEVGAVLLQGPLNSKQLFLCTYYLHKLNPAKSNYTIWDKEFLAVKVAFKVWWHHLKGVQHQVEVQADHWNLENLKTTR